MRHDSRRPSERFYDSVRPIVRAPHRRFWTRSVLPTAIAATLMLTLALVGWRMWPSTPRPAPSDEQKAGTPVRRAKPPGERPKPPRAVLFSN